MNPSSSPTFPPGFGIGHARPMLDSDSDSVESIGLLMASNCTMPSLTSGSKGILLLLRSVLPLASIMVSMSPSANTRRGAGHGSTCGRATTKKLATTVVAKSDEVMRDRGWRFGGAMRGG